jgi:hypothetical protein
MESNKKESKFGVSDPKWQPEKFSCKDILIGTVIIFIACACASYAQKGIDGYGDFSFVGFVVAIIVGFSVAFGLHRLYSDIFGK